MTTTRKDLEEIAHAIYDAQLIGQLSYDEANVFVDILIPALRFTTGLNMNGQPRFREDIFRKAAIRKI